MIMQSMSLFLLLASCPFDRLYQPSSLCCYHHSFTHSFAHKRTSNSIQPQIRTQFIYKKKCEEKEKKMRVLIDYINKNEREGEPT